MTATSAKLTIGYWDKTWATTPPPTGATMGIAFSGWTDPGQALANSNPIKASLAGAKFISLGGGNENGAFRAASFAPINQAIAGGHFAGWDGIAYDVELGDSGLENAFASSFALAKAQGFQVLVTISHSAPYGISDAYSLMQTFFANPQIDFLSPQLYTTGKEAQNDYATSAGVTWPMYANAKAKIVPSIVSTTFWPDGQKYFANQGVTLSGYVRWGTT